MGGRVESEAVQGSDEKRRDEDERLPLDEVRRLVDLLQESGVGEIRVRRGETEISVKAMTEARPETPAASNAAREVPEASEAVGPEELAEKDGLYAVRSPLVGTFYRAPAPGEEPYVEVGDEVSAGQTLCIVEAMKLMNEIPADVSGEVVEVLAENTGGVEYDQPLFYLRPAG